MTLNGLTTTRRLVLMRHAKSAWGTEASSDHARPLNGRGRRDAPRVAAWLEDLGWTPDAVISSDARRTRETWSAMAPVLGQDIPVAFERTLYLAGLGQLRALAEDWPADWNTVLALGHNPGWEEAVSALSQTSNVMKTGTCGLLQGHGETWAKALAGSWQLIRLQHPRLLDD